MKQFIETHATDNIVQGHINILGINFDSTSSYRKGSRFGPDKIREASDNLETYSPYLDKDLENFKVYDLGNLKTSAESLKYSVPYFQELVNNLNFKNDNTKLITLGGEHSISLLPIKKYLKEYPQLTILHLDAHADLREEYLGNPYSHASIIRRVLDNFDEQNQLVQYGIRSGTKNEFNYMRKNNTLCNSLEQLCTKVKKINTPIYLTLDLDFFDPSVLPGTGTPEAGGESFNSFIKILKTIPHQVLVGADIVELSPPIDPSGNSACFASKIVREIILKMTN